MISLNAVTRKLQAVLGGAVTANQLPITVHYKVIRTLDNTESAGCEVNNTNSTTAVDICNTPINGQIKTIESISVYNADSATATVTIRYNDNGTNYNLIVVDLATLNQLYYEQKSGWRIIDSSGNTKAAITETAQDAVGSMLTDTDTIDFTYTDSGPTVEADVRTQMSITSDTSGIKLSGDEASPGNSEFYGTNGSGTKGWYAQSTIDHGGLTGLADDDHTQYLRHDGTRALTANWDAGNFDIRLDEIVCETGIKIEKTSGLGIKVDLTTPTFPWRHLAGGVIDRGAGGTAPLLSTYIGNIKEFEFAVNDEVWVTFALPHDYVPGSDVYFDVNWSHNFTTVTGGTVTFGFDITYAKSDNQAAFITPVTPTLTSGTASTTQYKLLTESLQVSAASPSATQIDSDNLEVGGIILVRIYLSANALTVSGGGTPNPYIHNVHLMYQSTNIGTKARSPNFYT